MDAEYVRIHDPSGIRDGCSVGDETGESVFLLLLSHPLIFLLLFAYLGIKVYRFACYTSCFLSGTNFPVCQICLFGGRELENATHIDMKMAGQVN